MTDSNPSILAYLATIPPLSDERQLFLEKAAIRLRQMLVGHNDYYTEREHNPDFWRAMASSAALNDEMQHFTPETDPARDYVLGDPWPDVDRS